MVNYLIKCNCHILYLYNLQISSLNMKKIIIIGTLHAGLTPKNELKEVLEKYNPNQLLIEIAEEDIKNREFYSYPLEMVFAYDWANKNKVKVNGFDLKIDVLRKGMKEEDNQKVIEEQKKLMNNFSWKDMNKAENLKKLDTDSAKNLVDSKKEEKREFEMLKNIKNSMIDNGKILIITGCGHLDFFEKHIINAVFPFR